MTNVYTTTAGLLGSGERCKLPNAGTTAPPPTPRGKLECITYCQLY